MCQMPRTLAALAAAELFFGLLEGRDVVDGPHVPEQPACGITVGDEPAENPDDPAASMAEAVLRPELRACQPGPQRIGHDRVPVIGMKVRHPPAPVGLLRRHPHEGRPALVEIDQVALGVGLEDADE
jgi:hypothetical protein